MKKLVLNLALFLTFAGHCALADDDRAGGGGAQIEAAFRLRGYGLIIKVANNIQADKLCSSTTLQNSFGRTKIRIVPQLTDPSTNQPIDGNLDAWTVPGDMQLLKSSWKNLVGTTALVFSNGKSVNTLILHEMYRTTESCHDDNFQLSEKVIHLLDGEGTSVFSEVYSFKYRYKANTESHHPFEFKWPEESPFFETESGNPNLICTQPLKFNLPTAKDIIHTWEDGETDRHESGIDYYNGRVVGNATCISWDGQLKSGNLIIDGVWRSFSGEGGLHLIGSDILIRWEDGKNSKFEQISDFYTRETMNQLTYVSPTHPLVIVHDIQNGTWSWGIQ